MSLSPPTWREGRHQASLPCPTGAATELGSSARTSVLSDPLAPAAWAGGGEERVALPGGRLPRPVCPEGGLHQGLGLGHEADKVPLHWVLGPVTRRTAHRSGILAHGCCPRLRGLRHTSLSCHGWGQGRGAVQRGPGTR